MTSEQLWATAMVLTVSMSGAVSADQIALGLAIAETGSLATLDGPVVEGIELAVDEINAAGGIGGLIKIEMTVKDVDSDPAQTASATRELLDAQVNVLITPCDAELSSAAAVLAQDAKIPTFSTCVSSPALPMRGDFVFANFPGDNLQATVLATYSRTQGYNTAYILYSPDSRYGDLPLYFAEVFEFLGGDVSGQGVYSLGQEDFSAEIIKLKALAPELDVIMTSAYEPEFSAFLRQLRAAAVRVPVIASHGIDSPTTFSLAEIAEDVVFTTAGYPTPGSPLADFNAKYQERYGKASETLLNAVGYDLIKVIEAAVLAAGDTAPVALQQAIMNLEDVQGATSKITYKGTDGMPLREVALIQVVGGKRELLGRPTPDPALIPTVQTQQ